MGDTTNIPDREDLTEYLQDHLEVLNRVEIYLQGIKIWNYLIPILLLIVGLVLGYLLSYFLCYKKSAAKNNCLDQTDGIAVSAFKSNIQAARQHHGSSSQQAIPQLQYIEPIPNNIPRILDPRSPHYPGRRGSMNFPITEEVSRVMRYDETDGTVKQDSMRYHDILRDRLSPPMSTLGSTRGSTRGSVKLTGYESADSLSRRPYSHNGSMQRIRDHMERKIDRIEHRHQKEMAEIKLAQSRREQTVTANDELEYVDVKNPFYSANESDNEK